MLTLGINSAWHDSSVALVADGEVVFASTEERLSRIKHDTGFPALALRAGLRQAGLDSIEEVDGVAFGWNRPGVGEAFLLGSLLTNRIPFNARFFAAHVALLGRALYREDGKRDLEKGFGPPPSAGARFIDHHEAHAWSAFALSGFAEAAVLVVDGHGAAQASTIYDGSHGGLRRRKTLLYPNSLGSFYTAFTDLLGFESNSDEWKLMGLAAYGEPNVPMDDFLRVEQDTYHVNPRCLRVAAGGRHLLESRFGPRRNPDQGFTQDDKDLAASVQQATEEAMLMLARRSVELTGRRDLCLAGGVAMNSKANGRILASGLVDRLFVQPAATDDGTAIGAAIALQRRARPSMTNRLMEHVYLGPSFTQDQVRKVLDDARVSYLHDPDPERLTARLLAEGLVVGWFQGRMEFGPRALGNRSILGDPRSIETRDRVNASVKFREDWRPFAPACLAERVGEFFEPDAESPFMILTQTVRADKRSVIPAVTHVDNTARVQTVREEVNPRYWRLISEFDRLTGVPVVLNTSFNLRGEPIVCTPQDALRTFYTSGLDVLAIEDFLVPKDHARPVLERLQQDAATTA